MNDAKSAIELVDAFSDPVPCDPDNRIDDPVNRLEVHVNVDNLTQLDAFRSVSLFLSQ